MEEITSSQARMEEKLTEFKTEVWQGQEDAAARALKRVCYDKPYAFKRKGNEEQANFNTKLDKAIAEAEAELAKAGPSTTPSFQHGLQALQKGRKLIAEQQKLIEIADRSEHDWGVVAEYTTDELAEDSDEKRLEKAERAAEQKAVKRRKKRASAAPWRPCGPGQKRASAAPWRPCGPGQSGPLVPAAGVPPLAVQSLSRPAVPKPNMQAGRGPLGPCFAWERWAIFVQAAPRPQRAGSCILSLI